MTEPSVPLEHYYTHKDRCFGVGFHCPNGHYWVVSLDVVIADLERRGVGGRQTGVREVAKFVRKPCARCGSDRIETTPAWSAGPAQ